jgi:hypothetical protein
LGFGFGGVGFGVWGLGFGVWGLGFGVWGSGFGTCCAVRAPHARVSSGAGREWRKGLGFRVQGSKPVALYVPPTHTSHAWNPTSPVEKVEGFRV